MHPALPWRPLPAHVRLAPATHSRILHFALVALVGLGFALRVALLDSFPLREDEAIYGFWARAAPVDPFFLQTWPDKPPLFIWLLAGVMGLVGPSEAGARLVSIFAATLTIPVVAVAARRLWRSEIAALLAVLLIALNPFAVSFAPTAYTDSLLVLFGMGALACALRGRGLGAGLLLGAACMTKQQGLFYAPLIAALLLLPQPPQPGAPQRKVSQRKKSQWSGFGWMVIGVALVVLPVLWWDSQRWTVAPSPWALAQQTYAPLTLLPPQQWLGRGQEWGSLLWYLGGSWISWAVLGVATVVAAIVPTMQRMNRAQARAGLLLLGWGVCFVLLHVVTSLQVWDRYLLPLAPWLALIASGPLALTLHGRLPDWLRGLLFLLLVLGMAEFVPPALAAARGQIPIGGDHGDYAGLTESIAWVQHQCDGCPAILYHQVLGWHLRFYLYDDLQPDGDDPPRFDLRWFPSAAYLADNAAKSPYPPKYLILPEWATPRDLSMHLAMRGLALHRRLHVERFAVMEIVHLPRPACDWCKSSVPLPNTSFPLNPRLPGSALMPAAPQMSIP